MVEELLTTDYINHFSALDGEERLFLGKLGWNLALEKENFTEKFRLIVFAAEVMKDLPNVQAAAFFAAVSAGKVTKVMLYS